MRIRRIKRTQSDASRQPAPNKSVLKGTSDSLPLSWVEKDGS